MQAYNKCMDKMDKIITQSRKEAEVRERSYRALALKMYPWVCAKCAREFDRSNLRELTVHHIDHNHDNNPEDGSNWELLCLYCHDDEHARYLDKHPMSSRRGEDKSTTESAGKPFANLKNLLKSESDKE